jgi:hypothetical protein
MTQNDLIQAASQLPAQELEDFVMQITAIYRQRQVANRSHEETLLATIHRSLSPELQIRWDELIGKRDDATLSPTEYDELLQLTEQVEELNVQRITALSALAQLRGLDLRSMMRELNLPEPSYV